MLPKFSLSISLILVALLFQVVILALIGGMLRAGSGPIKENQPTNPDRYIIRIDTSGYTTEVNGKTFHGLPDSHDFSKTKDYFSIFPSQYCSGSKKDDIFSANYCSPWGKQFFDLHRLWRAWGVDLIKRNLVGQTPKMIYIGLLTTGAITALSLILGFITFCSPWGPILATTGAWIAAVSSTITAAVSHTFANNLASSLSELKPTGTGKLVARVGSYYRSTIWSATIFTFSVAFFWTSITWRARQVRSATANRSDTSGRSSKRVPFIGIVRRATGDFLGRKKASGNQTYKHLGGVQEVIGLASQDGQEIELVSRPGSLDHSRPGSRAGSRAGSRSRSGSNQSVGVLYNTSPMMEMDAAYEPLRHQEIPSYEKR